MRRRREPGDCGFTASLRDGCYPRIRTAPTAAPSTSWSTITREPSASAMSVRPAADASAPASGGGGSMRSPGGATSRSLPGHNICKDVEYNAPAFAGYLHHGV